MDVCVSEYISADLLATLQSKEAMNADGTFATTHTPAPYTRLLTTHDFSQTGDDGEPRVGYLAESGPGPWQQVAPNTFFSLVYSSSAPPQLNGDADAAAHNALLDSGDLGLVNPAGNVIRIVELLPRAADNVPHFMHRTESLDMGVILKGDVELHVPGSEPRKVQPGDVIIQRGTMHSWVNCSTTEPARILFCLMAAAGPVVTPAGKALTETLPKAPPGVDISIADALKARRTS